MAFDLHKNFAYSLVATAPSPATSGTSLVVSAGEGALFPTPPFNATIWATGAQPLAANAEIVRVTAISTDTLTIVRAQESTTARTIVAGDQIAATITVQTLTDVEKWIPSGSDIYYGVSAGNVGIGVAAPTYKLDVFSTSANGFRATGAIDINQVVAPTAPTMALITSAGNVDIGAHWYSVSYTTAVGETRVTTSAASITTDASNKQVTVTIPVSTDLRVTGRKIYRTKVGDPNTADFLLATIANNTATSYVDNIADASLTGNLGAGFFRFNTTHGFITINGVRSMVIDAKLTTLGVGAGAATTTGGRSVYVGNAAGAVATTGTDNTFLGNNAGVNNTTGNQNTIVGSGAGQNLVNGICNTIMGVSAGGNLVANDGCVFLGYTAGYFETGAGKLIIDNTDRGSEANARISSMIYGVFNTTVASQTLRFNAIVNIGANFSYTPSTETLALAGVDTEINITGITNEPSTPAAGILTLYTKAIAGKMVLKQKGPSGLDTPLQSCLYQNGIQIWTPTNVTGGNWQGDLAATTGTFTTAAITTTNTYTSTRRARYANVITTADQVLGVVNTNATWLRGNAASIGGFFYVARLGFDVWGNGGRFFAGFATATTVISANPSALANTCGFMVDSGDNGLIYFGTRDGTTSNKVSTGLTIVSNKGYDCYIFAAPNGSSISWRIVDMNTGTEASGTTSTNLPVNTTILKAMALASNAALTPATSVQMGVNRIYLESDF